MPPPMYTTFPLFTDRRHFAAAVKRGVACHPQCTLSSFTGRRHFDTPVYYTMNIYIYIYIYIYIEPLTLKLQILKQKPQTLNPEL